MKYTKQRKALFALVTLPLFGLALFGPGTASAHGRFGMTATPDEIATRQQEMFTSDATLLGISIDEVKEAWVNGKNIQQLAEEKGITKEQLRAKMEVKRLEQMTAQMKALVDKGIITQAQADARIAAMSTMKEKVGLMKDKMGGRGRGGFRF